MTNFTSEVNSHLTKHYFDQSGEKYICQQIKPARCIRLSYMYAWKKREIYSYNLLFPKEKCPPGFEWVSSVGSCYYVITTRTQHQPEAYAACQQHGPRVHLVAMETVQEYAFLESFLCHTTQVNDTFVVNIIIWINVVVHHLENAIDTGKVECYLGLI